MTDPARREFAGDGWHPTTVARRQMAKLVGTPVMSVLVGERHARRMGSLRTACDLYAPHWPMDLTGAFDPEDEASCTT